MSGCARCQRPVQDNDHAYCASCLSTPGPRGTRVHNAAADIDARTIERRLAFWERYYRRRLHVEAWAQRTSAPVGSRLEDHAPSSDDLPNSAEVARAYRARHGRDVTKATSRAWNGGRL